MIPFLHIGPIQIPTFGLMVATAMVVAYYVLRADMARRGIAEKKSATAELFIVVPALAGIAGAKLYHVLETPRELFEHPAEMLLSRYGLAWFGGLMGGLMAWVLLARWNSIPLLASFDAGSAAAALGYGVGRIGCLLSGDGDYGVPTSLPWGMSFPNGLVPSTQTCVERGWPPDCRVQPTPIYEFLVACVIAWILWRIGAAQIASSRARHRLPAGSVFAAYLLLTGVARFLVEFIRINPRSFFGFSNAQAASMLSMLLGALLWWGASSEKDQARRR
jgi:phosphatidylglycerol:prolipoprotein diacylglycerol transferase